MKKLTALLAAAALVICFTACESSTDSEATAEATQTAESLTTEVADTNTTEATSEATAEATPTTESPTAQEYDLEALYQAIIAAQPEEKQGEIFMFPEENPELIEMMYEGLGALAIEDKVFYVAPVTGFACEVMLIKAQDETAAQAAYDIFNARIQKGADDTFYPETAALWATNAQAQREGLYVCMVALPNGCTIPEDVFALI